MKTGRPWEYAVIKKKKKKNVSVSLLDLLAFGSACAACLFSSHFCGGLFVHSSPLGIKARSVSSYSSIVLPAYSIHFLSVTITIVVLFLCPSYLPLLITSYCYQKQTNKQANRFVIFCPFVFSTDKIGKVDQ